ncbi:SDR family oxidoreductase [Paenibacillus campi]|uniref:SDR family NAD(P)-dependent oxidoreductase n=1 Tax=Paenibacillus campi TaxID=3106031 RepID=UPI002AFE81C8|nr:SDR family oxidoreductase [Paenibacillus sp. SGZ-1014]
MVTLVNKIVLITGASSGIGARTAEMLVRQGAIPILTARSQPKLEQLSQQLQGQHRMFNMDVQQQEQIEYVVAQIVDEYGRIDILLNNAGYGQFTSILDTDVQAYEQMMDVNYMGTVRCTRTVLPHMLKAGQGQIINVASMAGKFATAQSTAYTATKFAVLGFTNSLRQELRGTGITVSAINPGPVNTAFFERADPSGTYVSNVSGFMLSTDKVCHELIRMMKRRREEVDLPRYAGVAVRLYQLCPRLIDRLTYSFFDRK